MPDPDTPEEQGHNIITTQLHTTQQHKMQITDSSESQTHFLKVFRNLDLGSTVELSEDLRGDVSGPLKHKTQSVSIFLQTPMMH